jgi:cellulose synthase (UDP-forming)
MTAYPEKPDAMARLLRWLVLCLTVFMVGQLISINLGWQMQAVLGCSTILLGIVADKLSRSRVVTIALMLISMTATLRYGWWRVRTMVEYFSDASNKLVSMDSAFMFILIAAEAYTVIIMVLGYMQTAHPLGRVPIPMPRDESKWPHVDVLIPTYNEALSLVRYTALAAINIDYPPDKLHVYILDDGTRLEFEDFCREAGVGYVTRKEHGHAKAGNINHALTTMNSSYVAIFDCDHVPTRSFLQMTLGWMLADQKLAMLQTPHHFYSPDPFERNLLQYKTIPNEAELFYGIVQDGNDLWNATFFCGSCALLRRSALDEVGGIAVETVTEDAHTSLRMQKHGYNTAYINIPQAAGLATETLAAHVGQRVRWARGMIQILRTDNPLFAWKMKITQRLCYFNAMAHFLYAVPRLVFLGAPLVYLLLQKTIIPGYWVAILAYALPHLILSSLTNSRVQGSHRHSFWNEIYEAVLAPYILMPTILALINPKLGKFNVTGKGSTLGKTYFDSKIAAPTKWMLLLNFIGLAIAPYRMLVTDPEHYGAVLMNVFWVVFNIVILGVAAAVALEQKQRRESVRIEARIPMSIQMWDGRQIEGISIDMSIGGTSVKVPADAKFTKGDTLRVAFPGIPGDENQHVDVLVVGESPGLLRLSFLAPTIFEQETLTRALYSRADAWIDSLESKEVDRPLVSLGRVIVLSVFGIGQVLKSLIPGRAAAILFLAVTLGIGGRALGQDPPVVPVAENVPPVLQSLSLKDMGLINPIEMRGPHSYYTLKFTLSHALVPRHGSLRLIYSMDPSLDAQTASLKLNLNGSQIAILPPPSRSGPRGGLATIEIPVLDALLVRSNTLTFEFNGSGVMLREDQAKAQVLCRVSPASTLEVSGDHLRLGNTLSQLPLPVFDTDLQTTTTVPFVFLTPPGSGTLNAAGVVASWLGLLASTKPVRFSVSVGQVPPGNVVLLSNTRSQLPAAFQLPAGNGPLIALRDNPSDEFGSVLVLAGEDDQQLIAAARALALTQRSTGTGPAQGLPMTGDTVQVPGLPVPARGRDDAPRWMSTKRLANLASCPAQEPMQTDGSSPIPVYFHVPPNLFFGETQSLAMRVHYRFDGRPLAPGSALRVVVNGRLVNEIPLLPGMGISDGERVVRVPVTDIRPFGNTILFNFDFIPADPAALQSGSGPALDGEILCDSSLDLRGLALWAPMPNLELFANAGFPFTRMADLSETVVVLPAAPSAAEISLFLHLMGHFGAQTGYPALRLNVEGPNTVVSAGRDYLILGTIGNQPAFKSLDALLPVTMDSSGVHVKPAQGAMAYAYGLQTAANNWWAQLRGNPVVEDAPAHVAGVPGALMEEIESPASPQRSIVVVALKQDSSADNFASVFLDRSQSGDITGTASLLLDSGFVSFPMGGSKYHAGDLSWYATMRTWFFQHFLLLLLACAGLIFIVGRWARDWLSFRARERLILAETANSED